MRKKREIAEKQIDEGRKLLLFGERKYQTLVSIFKGCDANGGGEEGLPGLSASTPALLPSTELQRQREVREHQVPAARPGQQGLRCSALQVVEQHIPGGAALRAAVPGKSLASS